jgi:hypothetical protein
MWQSIGPYANYVSMQLELKFEGNQHVSESHAYEAPVNLFKWKINLVDTWLG